MYAQKLETETIKNVKLLYLNNNNENYLNCEKFQFKQSIILIFINKNL